jgi:putative flippase GtrA
MTVPAITASPSQDSAASRKAIPQFGQFVLVGLSGVGVNLVVFSLVLAALTGSFSLRSASGFTDLLTRAPVGLGATLAASVVAFAVATLWNFTFNSLWTFRSRRGHRHGQGRRLALYYGVSLGSLGVNEVVLYALYFAIAPLFAQGVGIVAGSLVGFVGNRRFTFEELSPTTSA